MLPYLKHLIEWLATTSRWFKLKCLLALTAVVIVAQPFKNSLIYKLMDVTIAISLMIITFGLVSIKLKAKK